MPDGASMNGGTREQGTQARVQGHLTQALHALKCHLTNAA